MIPTGGSNAILIFTSPVTEVRICWYEMVYNNNSNECRHSDFPHNCLPGRRGKCFMKVKRDYSNLIRLLCESSDLVTGLATDIAANTPKENIMYAGSWEWNILSP